MQSSVCSGDNKPTVYYLFKSDDVNYQEASRISSRVSIMGENCESHSDMESVSESKVHKRKPTLRDSELCCEVSMTRSNVELVSEGKKIDSSTRPRSATGAISRRKKSHSKGTIH
ncbi:hypothetical protein LOD99_8578 [Oopsacas minuta]|uniref:Uncharacterized protein n=1 Tax=Oopsacas minuta TaxID=111878 RepID=A0AAV7JG31_9METZ|nr:hypothetical protein LOD99_8578 [Oopsacas minuta]